VALYLQNLPPLYPKFVLASSGLSVGHFWSLAVEEQYYLLWPLCLVIFWRRNRALHLCVGLFLMTLIFRIICVSRHADLHWCTEFLIGRAGELAIGSALAVAIRSSWKTIAMSWAPWAFVISGLLIVGISLKYGTSEYTAPMATAGLSLFGIFSASLIALCLRPGLSQRVFEMRFLQWVGKISYGVYVYHVLFGPLYGRFIEWSLPGASPATQRVGLFIVAAAVTLPISLLSYYTFESFFLRAKERFTLSDETKGRDIPESVVAETL